MSRLSKILIALFVSSCWLEAGATTIFNPSEPTGRFEVEVREGAELRVEDVVIDHAQFSAFCRMLTRLDPGIPLLLRMDPAVDVDDIRELVKLAKEAGIARLVFGPTAP